MTALIRIDRSWTSVRADRPRPIRFCSRCGHPSEEPPHRPDVRGRVCDRCGMGMLLTCSRAALPGEAAAFLIATFDLTVSAVSQAGERIFGAEQELVGTPLAELLGSPLGDDQFARHCAQAAQRACDPVVMPVRLHPREGRPRVGTLAARIATCGPPRAALLTVEPSEFGRR
jgi:PAS domain-containing protein